MVKPGSDLCEFIVIIFQDGQENLGKMFAMTNFRQQTFLFYDNNWNHLDNNIVLTNSWFFY